MILDSRPCFHSDKRSHISFFQYRGRIDIMVNLMRESEVGGDFAGARKRLALRLARRINRRHARPRDRPLFSKRG